MDFICNSLFDEVKKVNNRIVGHGAVCLKLAEYNRSLGTKLLIGGLSVGAHYHEREIPSKDTNVIEITAQTTFPQIEIS